MEGFDKIWQVEIEGEVFDTDLETLKNWIKEGKVQSQHKVRRGSLRWISVAEIPILMQCFEKNTRLITQKETPTKTPPVTVQRRNPSPRPTVKPYKTLPPKTKSNNPISLSLNLIIIAIISVMLGFGWVMYSDYRDKNTVVDYSNPSQLPYIPPAVRVKEIEAALIKVNNDLNNPRRKKGKTEYFECYEQKTRTSSGPAYDGKTLEAIGNHTTIEFYNELNEKCAADKQEADTESIEYWAKKSEADKEQLETERKSLRNQMRNESTMKFVIAFILSFSIVGIFRFIMVSISN